MACESCDSCNACYFCNSCNSCNSCNASCEGTCQSNKQKVSQELGKFKFRDEGLGKNDLFLTAEEWNSLLDYISDGYGLEGSPLSESADSVYEYKDEGIRAGKKYGNEFMSANMYNGAISKMRYATEGKGEPGEEYVKTGGPNGDIIYASYFTALEKYANDEFSIKYCNTCDNCNSCDSSCQGCNSCNICNSCQGKNSCTPAPPISLGSAIGI